MTIYLDGVNAAANPGGSVVFKGDIDASTDPDYPLASAGDMYLITVAGKVGGASGEVVEAFDVITARVDTVGGNQVAVGDNWFVAQGNVFGATETTAGTAELVTQVEMDGGVDDVRIVTAKKHRATPHGWKVSKVGFSDSPYSVPSTDFIGLGLRLEVDTTGGAVLLTLPLASSVLIGCPVTIVDIADNAEVNAITILRSGTDTIQNEDSQVLDLNGDAFSYVPDGVDRWGAN